MMSRIDAAGAAGSSVACSSQVGRQRVAVHECGVRCGCTPTRACRRSRRQYIPRTLLLQVSLWVGAYKAELASTILQMITRSGTNAYHGSAFAARRSAFGLRSCRWRKDTGRRDRDRCRNRLESRSSPTQCLSANSAYKARSLVATARLLRNIWPVRRSSGQPPTSTFRSRTSGGPRRSSPVIDW